MSGGDEHRETGTVETLSGRALIEAARTIATAAHAGQQDKAGLPYITHPERVAARICDPSDPEPTESGAYASAAGWLHDVLEDTEVTGEDLLAAGIPPQVIAAVVALTRLPTDQGDEYYARVAADPLALRVKYADIADNTDPARQAKLPARTQERLRRKYSHALSVLGELAGG